MYFIHSIDVTAYGNAFFGPGAGSVLLDNVECGGHESSILNCTYTPGANNCPHSKDAGVGCYRKSTSLIIIAKEC
jgi:deleted-in-malignant-brain-tumors protein 1